MREIETWKELRTTSLHSMGTAHRLQLDLYAALSRIWIFRAHRASLLLRVPYYSHLQTLS